MVPQSYRSPSMRPKTTPSRPRVSSATPGRSRRCLRPGRTSGMNTHASATSRTPIGTFRKKIHRHPACVTISPPSVGPSSTPSPDMMPVAAKAGPRFSAGRIEVMIARPCGASSAAPTPCSGAESDELAGCLGHPGGQAGGREHRDAEQEHRPRADDVAEPAGGDQQHGVGERVGGADPEHGLQPGVQVGDQIGDGDVDDGDVEQRHEQAQAEQGDDEDGADRAAAVDRHAGDGHGVGPAADVARRGFRAGGYGHGKLSWHGGAVDGQPAADLRVVAGNVR